ncbi:hypothetical protein Poli38472_011671 [Pythium oligandrum]|uniref:glucan endo-1,3-beta-D-glucosidase n=1 Tax=Pythium oligandrum TaxID=41045 RepID=A0A8K1FDM3_PYTOL|nr:hypothetical protein Poli38472_013780 [Pythium oligandrum]TMW64791.1 hypothetical protein Poli38472_011671 [Pythium oligandrum]|eukprot:TMW55018.1 hypothetical protein Poli38472_013780 [Pythium oligandrum]
MKTFLLALVLAIATLCISVNVVEAKGVCYDPIHGSAKVTRNSINADLRRLREAGFRSVRVYTATLVNENLGKRIIDNKMNAAITVPFVNDRPGDSESHIKAAIEAAKYRVGNNRVTHIYVGNENLASVNAVPQKMFDYIARIKAAVPSDVRVGTVQRNTEYLDPARNGMSRLKELLSKCTIVGVNIHPVFTPNTPANKAINVVNAQWNQLMGNVSNRFPGLSGKIAITEVGWPSGGSLNGNTGSKSGALTFMKAYAKWRRNNIIEGRSFFFQAFDQPQRTDGPFEKFFGVFNSDRSKKYSSFNFNDM